MKSLFNRSAQFYRNWFWVCLILILTASSIPRIPDPTLKLESIHFEFRTDYFLHLLQYAVLSSIFIFWQYKKNGELTKKLIIYTFIAGILLGTADELHQIFIPSRRFNPIDLSYNCLGIISGVIFSSWYLNRTKRQSIKNSGEI
jgi:VanZ family protein